MAAVTLPCTVPSDGREGRDREPSTLEQEQLIKQVFSSTRRPSWSSISSFPYTINWTQANVPAILHMAHSSQDEGTALAKVLFGDVQPRRPSGVTWPKSIDQLPPMMDYNIRDGRTYMYFKGEPLYPFGFGLSYTTFKFSNIKPSSRAAKDGTSRQRGCDQHRHAAGDDVVQLYVQHPIRPSRPRRRTQRLPAAHLARSRRNPHRHPPAQSLHTAWWNDKLSRFVVEKEPVELRIGDSSHNILLTTRIQIH